MASEEKKPFYKKAWFWIIVVVIVILIVAFSGSSEETTETSSNETNNTSTSSTVEELKIGDTWTVDGQWSLTINSVTTTTYRNEYADTDPEQVVYVTYTYENLGWEDEDGLMDGLYFDLSPNGCAITVDGSGEVASEYPGDITTYPTETPVGATCKNAQVCIGLNNESDTIEMTITKYDTEYNQQKVKYVLDVD